MSEKRAVEKALSQFRTFISGMKAFKASSGPSNQTEGTVEEPVQVSREDAMKVFLKHSPEFEPFRVQLVDEVKGENPYFLKRAMWEEATA